MIRKRSLDLVGSLAGLFVLCPVGVVIALLIKLTMPGPVFFQQWRVGKKGKLFQMLNFVP